jgi:hypothetical protein
VASNLLLITFLVAQLHTAAWLNKMASKRVLCFGYSFRKKKCFACRKKSPVELDYQKNPSTEP